MARFTPNFAQSLEPLRRLTKKDVVWYWNSDCENVLNEVKRRIAQPPILTFYDLVLQVDSSKNGLGAALLQNDQPIEYASTALTRPERNWAQIEKELLSVRFRLVRFDQYTYGRKVIIHNDHRPLETILKKPLSQASKRLQALAMRINRYYIEFNYVPGSAHVIADTLSRAYPELDDSRHRIAQFSLDPIWADIPDETLSDVANAVINDEESQPLMSVIKKGWPDNKAVLHDLTKPYFAIRDSLSCDDNVIMKGERVFIPKCQRQNQNTASRSLHRS